MGCYYLKRHRAGFWSEDWTRMLGDRQHTCTLVSTAEVVQGSIDPCDNLSKGKGS